MSVVRLESTYVGNLLANRKIDRLAEHAIAALLELHRAAPRIKVACSGQRERSMRRRTGHEDGVGAARDVAEQMRRCRHLAASEAIARCEE